MQHKSRSAVRLPIYHISLNFGRAFQSECFTWFASITAEVVWLKSERHRVTWIKICKIRRIFTILCKNALWILINRRKSYVKLCQLFVGPCALVPGWMPMEISVIKITGVFNSSLCSLTDRITCRQILNFMVILGFMFNYMLRVNLTIAIVEMVEDEDMIILGANSTEPIPYSADGGTKFHWDKYAQNQILGSFFWGYVLTELPGGRLAEIIGAKRVFGGGMAAASVLTVLVPGACHLGYIPVIILRVLLGFFLGATWPSIPPMAAKWIPPMERSKFIANMMASSLGAALTMPVCGFLIAQWGWESVFYITGGIGILWSLAWFLFIYDSPAQHPRISLEERMDIEQRIIQESGSKPNNKPSKVPWMAILSSAPVWAIIITHGCSVFGYFTVVNQLPTYMKEVLHFNVKKNGLLSSLPYLGEFKSPEIRR